MVAFDDYMNDCLVNEAHRRKFIAFSGTYIQYNLGGTKRSFALSDPEELVRARAVSYLILKKSYSPQRIRVEVKVPRRTPSDWADIVVYSDDDLKAPYLVVETKAPGKSDADISQAIEQLFGNANSLRSPYGLLDYANGSIFFDVMDYPAEEREENRRGGRESVPELYGQVPSFRLIAGQASDIRVVGAKELESKVKRAHSIIWAGGKRDPLFAFREWSKLVYAKIEDERMTRSSEPRRFQVGANESDVKVSTRVQALFCEANARDGSVFPGDEDILLPDQKIVEVVRVLEDVSFTDTDLDVIGRAFEFFFGSVFRGELGQYFTMRPLARFALAMLDPKNSDHIIDITCGSGGFLLEALMQVWAKIAHEYQGRGNLIEKNRIDFAQNNIYGIEIHRTLAQICRINLLIHHDGHCNIEGDRSCLDREFVSKRLAEGMKFELVVGNPPFGDSVKEGDRDQLGANSLSSFELAKACKEIPSEHIIIEQAVNMLCAGGRFALVVPDGVLNNQSAGCAKVRRFLGSRGFVEAVVSLPDYAFRTSGAQNKTSILFFRKFSDEESNLFRQRYDSAGGCWDSILESTPINDQAFLEALSSMEKRVFFAEAENIGYTSTGRYSPSNDLYSDEELVDGFVSGAKEEDANKSEKKTESILKEFRRFQKDPHGYDCHQSNCVILDWGKAWSAHHSHRLDAKYHVFKARELEASVPKGWARRKLGELLEPCEVKIKPEATPDRLFTVLSLSQNGEFSAREAGKGNNPPEWLGMYFEDSPSTWYEVHEGDIVYSSIDLWRGCIGVVPKEFDGAIVTKEFPVYRLSAPAIDPSYLDVLLRSESCKRAFRAITTGHSNRRRTQRNDFENLEVCFPEKREEQLALVKQVVEARRNLIHSREEFCEAQQRFNEIIDKL